MWIILLKDLRQRAVDSTLVVFALVLPLGMAFVLNLVLGGGGASLKATYAVVNADTGPVGKGFVAGVLKPLEGSADLTVRELPTAEAAQRAVNAGEVDAAFLVPPDLSANLAQGRQSVIQVIGSARSPIAVQVAREVTEFFAADLTSVERAVVLVAGDRPTAEQRAALASRAQNLPPPVVLSDDGSAAHRELDTTTFYAAGMAMFFLFFAVLFNVASIFEERRTGTLSRLLAAPIGRRGIIGAKLLSGVIVGVVSISVLVVATSVLLGARWGDPLGVAALVIAAVLAANGVMVAVVTFARSAEQASNWQSVVAMVLGTFGGVFFPVAQLGDLAAFRFLTPHGWFMSGMADLAGGGSVDVVLLPVAALLGFAVLGGGVAMFRIGRILQL
ncbi:ABC transporter permease [Nonomuraea sp. NN258]|uniref:ABC transporter permease n=1 Tax=Nonomuraea antri TaxID=2730852 RepID=UPI001569BC99|nr:ABC transporter permease [Nonomuraea antri]NRQ31687.1 ABC transporter permease [Nonomuraea antri]